MQFSINRLFKLMKRDFIVHKKSILGYLLVMFVFSSFVMWMVSDVDSDGVQHGLLPPDAGEIVFTTLLLVTGAFFTFTIFREFRSDTNRLQYLQLPASNFEKVFSRWFYTLPGFVLLTTVVFLIVYNVVGSVIEYYLPVTYSPLSDMNFKILYLIVVAYALGHSIVFILTLIHNRYVIPLSMLTGILVIVALVLGAGILLRVIFFDHFTGIMRPSEYQQNVMLSTEFKDWAEGFFSNIHWYLLMTVLPFLWVVSYFLMKEKEA